MEPITAGMPYNEREAASGRFAREHDDTAFLEAISGIDGDATTRGVGEIVGCAYRTAYERLTRLEDAGRVESRSIGRTKVWSVSDAEVSP